MIEIGTVLQPRDTDDPIVRVCGIEGDRYILQSVEFGSCLNFGMDTDEITATYVCDDYRVRIEQESEQDAWARFSTEHFDRAQQRAEARRMQSEYESLESPNEVFERQAAEAAA